MIASRTPLLRSAAARVVRRPMSSEPKMHKASDKWADLIKQRAPKDHLDTHLVFHPPYNGVAVGIGVFCVWMTGYGVIAYGISHQQYKQGFWK